jgi:hypothetical protein
MDYTFQDFPSELAQQIETWASSRGMSVDEATALLLRLGLGLPRADSDGAIRDVALSPRPIRKVDFSTLIPELPDWNNGAGINVHSWIGCSGDFQKAIGYSTIFWPEFIEVDGCIVLADTPPDNVARWLNQTKGDKQAAEAVMNHLHLRDLHYYGCPDATPERLAYLGEVLKDIYECKLRRDFPGRELTVELQCPKDDSSSIDDYILMFYQGRRPSATNP